MPTPETCGKGLRQWATICGHSLYTADWENQAAKRTTLVAHAAHADTISDPFHDDLSKATPGSPLSSAKRNAALAPSSKSKSACLEGRNRMLGDAVARLRGRLRLVKAKLVIRHLKPDVPKFSDESASPALRRAARLTAEPNRSCFVRE